MINNNQITTHYENHLWFKLYILKTHEIRLWYLLYFYFFLLKPMGGRKRSLNLVGPGQGQRPPVFLFYTIHI